MKNRLLLAMLMLGLCSALLFAGTTGKIAGQVSDSKTGEPLIGANVVLEGTLLGAAADLDGYFVILNVPPGEYNLKASLIGYSDIVAQNVRVNIDLTTNQNFSMTPTVLESEDAIVIVADRPVVQRDIAASTVNISVAEIKELPVQSLTDAIGLQPGIIGLSVRGSGEDQVAFQVDGFTLRDERQNSPFTGVSLSAVQDVQIQTGGFNAEYGNVRSSVINVVTKEGNTQNYEATLTYQYSPPAAKHFGPSFNDPNSYWLRPFLDPEVAWTGTQNGAWDQATQNQYPAFSGWNTISQQTLLNSDPGDDLSPAAAQRLFKWQHRRETDITEADYNVDAGFGGPVPFLSDKLGRLRFFASVRSIKEMYMVPFARDAYREDAYQLKLTSDISNKLKLTVSGLMNNIEAVSSNDVGEPGFFRSPLGQANVLTRAGFIDSRIFYDSYWALTDVNRYNIAAKISHTLSSKTLYEVQLEQTRSKYDTNPGSQRDTSRVFEIIPGFFVDEAPFGNDERLIFGIDGLLMGVRANARDFSKITTTTFKADLTSQVNSTNLFKAGIEVVHNKFDMRFGAINNILPTARPWTDWERSPIRGAIYVQDKLEFKGLVANVGLRADYIDPRGTWFDVSTYDRDFFSTDYDPASEGEFAQVSVDRQLNFSPRLAVSHPITEFSKIYFNYGHFRQMPISDRLYTVERITGNQLSEIGDPNLPLQKTVAYELGYEHSLLDQYLIRVAGYYKDITNQADRTRFTSTDGKVRYLLATSNSYEDIRGAEVSLQKRRGKWLRGFANYTYQASTSGFFGLGQFFENPSDQRQYERENPPDQSRPIARPYARLNLQLMTPNDFGPRFIGNHILGKWNSSLVGTWRAGPHFTWNPVAIPGILNNVQWRDNYDVDLRIARVFKADLVDLTFFVDIQNLFNIKNWFFSGGSPTGFVDGQDYNDYMFSLRLPKNVTDELNYIPINGNGDDRPGIYRPDDIAFDPLESNPNNDPGIAARNQKRIDDKAYIDNPNQKFLQFLGPRDVYFGLRVSVNLR